MSTNRAALVVGVDEYSFGPLSTCVADVKAIAPLLQTHEDGSPNFDCVSMLGETGRGQVVTRRSLREQVETLFSRRVEMALLYFSGHGAATTRGGVLVTQDVEDRDEGVTMDEIVEAANKSSIAEVTLVLDCCFSGKAGETAFGPRVLLREGLSIIAATTPSDVAYEGVFTELVCGALAGGGADVVGDVTAASVYAYVEQALGGWDQRPMFRANVARLAPLRKCRPHVKPDVLRKISTYFPTPDHRYQLDPSYEWEESHKPPSSQRNPVNEAIFKELQSLRDARLVIPIDADAMFWAAIHSKSCVLTPLGRFYWRLSKEGRI
jgi:hypothetical protein